MRTLHGKMTHKIFHLNNKICKKENEETDVKPKLYYQLSVYSALVTNTEKILSSLDKQLERTANEIGQAYPPPLVPIVIEVENESYNMFGGDGNNLFSGIGDALYDASLPSIVLFYANWCKFSREFLPTWDKMEDKVKNGKMKINVIKVDADKYKSLSDQFDIQGFPTIKLIGKNVVTFNDGRTLENLMKFISKNI